MKYTGSFVYISNVLGYLIIFPVVVLVVFVLMGMIETRFNFHTWDKPIDIGMILGSIVFGSPIYIVWAKILRRFGVSLKNRKFSHFSQCVLLYLLSLLLVWQLWLSRGSFDIPYAYAVLVVSCAIVGIVCNAVFLLLTIQSQPDS